MTRSRVIRHNDAAYELGEMCVIPRNVQFLYLHNNNTRSNGGIIDKQCRTTAVRCTAEHKETTLAHNPKRNQT